MPSSINGIGTSYYGKKHLHTVQGQCEFCGQQAVLSSYDTAEYFTLLYVPLIPFRQLRILSDCSVCRRHRAMPLKTWNTTKDKMIVEVVGQLTTNPGDPDVAKQAISTAIGFQDEPLFQAAVASVDNSLDRDASVQTVIGDGQRYFGHLPEATTAYRKAFDAEDTPETRENLAVVLLKQSQPQEAEKLLAHIQRPEDTPKAGYLWLLAAGYQAEGMHREALAAMERILVVQPAAAGNKEFRKLKQLSEKNLSTNKRIRNESLNPKEAAYKATSLSSKLGPLIGPLVAVALLVAYLGSAAYYGQNRKVFVVNGLNVPYSVAINGKQVDLLANSRHEMTMPEGSITVSMKSENLSLPEQQVEMLSNFWQRPFFRQTWIINPDRTALIAWEKQYYAERIDLAPAGESQLHTGSVLHGFASVDFVFEEFPQTIKTDSSGAISRTRVGVLPIGNMQPLEMFAIVSEELGGEQSALEWLKMKQQSQPNDEQWLGLLRRFSGPEQMLALLRPQLEQRPVLLNPHRAYQSLMEELQPEHDLIAEYQQLLKDNPDTGEFAYLLGRIEPDAERSQKLFEQALQTDPPVAFAALALGKQYLAEGDFPRALKFAEQAYALNRNDFSFQWLRRDCLLANQRYQELLEWTASPGFGLMTGLEVQSTAMQAEALRGKPSSESDEMRARRILGSFASSPEMVRQFSEVLAERRQYIRAAVSERQPVSEERINYDIENMQADAEDPEDADAPLFMFVVSKSSGDVEAARKHLLAAVEILKSKDRFSRELAAALGPGGKADPDYFLKQVDEVSSKRIWLAALAERFPKDADKYRELGVKLNFDRSVPYYWLRNYWQRLEGR